MNYTTDSTENWSIIPQCWPSLEARGRAFLLLNQSSAKERLREGVEGT